ncbi:hypothetical protein BDV28DRAFT_134088 [Aspergillus coremiiformis]|uniref:Leucine-rich repeat domain-containing protein n=1 Tax=Aspergillus coremiiformis TaxID=138285 RepID=A0A5N6Z761_9EURO|nr:hypothetical protein BDV28DRAFT_134088 [Aspergillus coremiiformis]
MMSDILCRAARRQRPFHQTPPYPYLREVLVDVQWGDGSIDSDFLTPLFYFPAVRKIHGGRICESYPDHPNNMILDISHSSRPVREFTVEPVYVCRGMLDWLAASTELEHIGLVLSVHPHDDPSQLSDDEMFEAPEFRHALVPFTRTLKTLRLETFYDLDDDWSIIADDAGPLGSLKEFAVLENLRIRYLLLIQPSTLNSIHGMKRPLVDILPSSLKILEVVEIKKDHFADLLLEFSQLVQYRAFFPQLERVTLYVERSFQIEDLQDSLRHEYKATGIEFEVKEMLCLSGITSSVASSVASGVASGV